MHQNINRAIPGFRIEASQGTHFFQNITSLGVGYLTIDTVLDDNAVDTGLISGLRCIEKGKFVKLYAAPEGLAAYIDRESNRALVGY